MESTPIQPNTIALTLNTPFGLAFSPRSILNLNNVVYIIYIFGLGIGPRFFRVYIFMCLLFRPEFVSEGVFLFSQNEPKNGAEID